MGGGATAPDVDAQMKTIRLTENLKARVAIVRRGAEIANGGGRFLTYSGLDLLKVELANELLEELSRQDAAQHARLDRLNALPPRRPVAVVEVSLQPKSRRRRA